MSSNCENRLSSSTDHLEKFVAFNPNRQSQNLHRQTHQRTRSVDLRLNYPPTISLSAPLKQENVNKSSIFFVIEENVSKIFYRYGLFCSRHSTLFMMASIISVALISHQMITFRAIFGSSYDVYISDFIDIDDKEPNLDKDSSSSNSLWNYFNIWPDSYVRDGKNDDSSLPPWFQSNSSFAYVLQIYIRSAVIPWTKEMQLVDALRGPFEKIFDIIKSVQNFHTKNDLDEEISLNDVCFHIFEPTFSKRYSNLWQYLPSYSCLILSPANIWLVDRNRFLQDNHFLNTLLMLKDLENSPLPSGVMHDLVFGVNFEETGIRRTYGQSRTRTITYAITMVLRRNSKKYVQELRSYLNKRFRLSSNNFDSRHQKKFANDWKNQIKHIYFHNTFTYNYIAPLLIIYLSFSLYMYYSVRKVEIISSKRLYSFCTLLTVLMSLSASFGICFRLRFNSVLIVNRFLPYFVAIISFENMLILTKSIFVNPHLDSKVLVAQALSREGVSVKKNLLIELILLSIGSFAFTPFFQECCKIAAICILSDFLIQTTFFMSFLSKLIQRINQREINKYSDKISILSNTCPLKTHFIKTPKRLKFINFLARLRLVQRFIILLLSACIGCAIYNAYLVLEQNDSVDIRTTLPAIQLPSVGQKKPFPIEEYHKTSISNTIDDDQAMSSSKSFLTLLESKYFSTPLEPSLNEMESKLLFTNENKMPKILPNHHWTNLFSLYNISLIGQFISILPPILISIPVKPESIEKIRNPSDSDYNLLKKFIPTKFVDGEYKLFDEEDSEEFDRMKKSSVISDNFNIIIGLWMPSFILFVYLIVQLYQCFCTRNYAEWRSGLTSNNLLNQFRSWMKTAQLRNINHEKLFTINISMLNYDKEKLSYSSEKEFSLDNQEIDLIAATVETSLIATVSMSGDIRVYDSLTFECLGSIKRSKAKGQFSFFKAFTYEDETKSDKPNSPIVVKSEDNLLRKWFLSLENDSNHEKNTFLQEDFNEDTEKIDFRPIWSIDLFDRFVLIGCGGDDGRLEVYDAYTGRLVFVYTPETPNKTSLGITAIKSTLWGVVLARLNGQLEILELMDQYKPKNYNSIHSMSDSKTILYTSKSLIQAHKQPLSSIEIIDFTNEDEFLKIFGVRGCLITGSLDTTLKVFALENLKLIFTLRGHYGPINTAVIDSFSAATTLSGCQLGQLCVWDISTGTCLFSIQAHQEAEIISITTSSLYYATAGTNNKICIWDRFSGNSIHKIDFQYNFCRNMIFLSSYILMTARKNDLVIWDINDARIICLVPLSNQENSNRSIEKNSELSILNQSVLIRNLMFTYQQKAIVCDYGYSVCIVDNPFVTKKSD